MTDFFDGVRMGSFDTEYDDDTIEMVLTESAMHLLAQAAAQTETPSAQPAAQATPDEQLVVDAQTTTEAPAAAAKQQPIAKDPVPPGSRPPMSTLRFALILSVVAIGSALLTAGTYFLATRASPPAAAIAATPAPATAAGSPPPRMAAIAPTSSPAAAATPPPPAAMAATTPPSPLPATAAPGAASAAVTALTPAPESAPLTDQPATIRFVNPFDRREVFEFPAGTSQADARDAVADLLAERARDRRVLSVKSPRRNGKTANSGAPVVASGIAPRS
jgi:hypothetical protein